MDNSMVQVYKNVIFRNKIGIPTNFGLRNPVIQKTFQRKCTTTSIVECVDMELQVTLKTAALFSKDRLNTPIYIHSVLHTRTILNTQMVL